MTRTHTHTTLATLAALGLAAALPHAARAQSVTNGGFETPTVPGSNGSNYVYDPSNFGWAFNARSGVAGVGSAFGNSNASDNTQVAFLQSYQGFAGAISQDVSGFTPGQTYSLSFDTANRPGNNQQTVTVSLFGTTYTLQPFGTVYNRYTLSNVLATGGTGTLTLAGAALQNDETAFVDNVAVGPDVTTAAIADGDFSGYQIAPGGADYLGSGPNTVGQWTYRGGGAGILNGPAGGGFGPPLTTGQQTAFVQGSGSSVSQLVPGFEAGSVYTLNFSAAPRYVGDSNDFEALLDPTFNASGAYVAGSGTLLGTFDPNASGSFKSFSTGPFTASTGDHVVSFLSLDTATGDRTSYIDDVSLTVAAPEPSQFAGLALGVLGLGALGWKARKRA